MSEKPIPPVVRIGIDVMEQWMYKIIDGNPEKLRRVAMVMQEMINITKGKKPSTV